MRATRGATETDDEDEAVASGKTAIGGSDSRDASARSFAGEYRLVSAVCIDSAMQEDSYNDRTDQMNVWNAPTVLVSARSSKGSTSMSSSSLSATNSV